MSPYREGKISGSFQQAAKMLIGLYEELKMDDKADTLRKKAEIKEETKK